MMDWLKVPVGSHLVNDGKHVRKFGIEVEAEFDAVDGADNVALGVDYSQWRITADYSLRGESSVEVISSGSGKSRLELNKSLPILMETLASCGMRETPRASTHIHINMYNANMKTIANFLAMYYLIEDNLSLCVGRDKGRVGNLFCLRLSDAEVLALQLKKDLESGFQRGDDEALRKYAAMNLYTMYKFGTLEYRVLMTERDCSKVLDCLRLFTRMMKMAARWESPTEIIEYGSFHGYEKLCKEIVPSQLVKRGMSLDVHYESVLNMQHVFYSLKG